MSNDFDDCAIWTQKETAKRIAEERDKGRRILDGSLMVAEMEAGKVPPPPEVPECICLGTIADVATALGDRTMWMGLPPTVDGPQHMQAQFAEKGIAPFFQDLLGRKVGETWPSLDSDFGEMTVLAVKLDKRLEGLIAVLGQTGSRSAHSQNGKQAKDWVMPAA